jgi:hypothetical protein
MSQSISVLQKKRGRPATGIEPMRNFRAPDALIASVDNWIAEQADKPSRSEAIRRLIEAGLASSEKE